MPAAASPVVQIAIAILSAGVAVLLSRRARAAWPVVARVAGVGLGAALLFSAPVHALVGAGAPDLLGPTLMVPVAIAAIAITALQHHRLRQAADALVPGALLGYALLKGWCWLAGCCRGARTFGWWAVRVGHNHFVHPVQLYEASAALLLFIACVLALGRVRRGLVAFLGFPALLAIRALAEPLRESYQQDWLLDLRGLTPALLVFVAGSLGAAIAATVAERETRRA